MVKYIVIFAEREHSVVFHTKRVFFRRVFLLFLSAFALFFSPVYGAQSTLTFEKYKIQREDLRQINQKLYSLRAHDGDPGAQYNLGLLLLTTTSQSNQIALDWISRAAHQKYAPALHTKGRLALQGKWPGLSVVKARKLLAEAAQLGYISSHLILAKSLVWQTPVMKNVAIEWLRKGARLRDNKCMAMLGRAYDSRGFLKERLANAYFWYTLAWFHRNKAVKSALHRLELRLSKQDRIEISFLLESHFEAPLEVIEYENGKIFPETLNS